MKPVRSASSSSAVEASRPTKVTVIVESAVRSASRRFFASSEARSASRRVTSFSRVTSSATVSARASSRRALSTRARWVVIRASRSTVSSVTSWVRISRRCCRPNPASSSTSVANFAAGTRSSSSAWAEAAALRRWSPPTNPPAAVTASTARRAAPSTSSTCTRIVPV